MIVHVRHRRATSCGLLLIPLLCVLHFARFTSLSAGLDLSLASYDAASEPSHPSEELVLFWVQLLNTMMQTKPHLGPLVVEGMPRDQDMDPNKLADHVVQRPDRIQLSDAEHRSLKQSHADFVEAATQLAPKLPYKKKSRGIVTTAGGPYIGMAITSILMLRRTGSQLPVQLFLDSAADYNEELCENTLPSLGAECMIMEKLWDATPSMPHLKKFQFKIFSILFSTFQDVLFLDADCWPIHNPDKLFRTNPFRSHGFVTWPDLWLSTASPVFYDVANIAVPSVAARRSSESGILMYDKAKHASSILLAAYYNFYGPDYYYVLLSQGAHGQGDKETFIHGAMAMGNPFYDVQTHMGFVGRWINGSYETAGMKQADPVEDYRLSHVRQRPMKNKLNYGKKDQEPEDPHARWLFIHHNLVKVDIRHLGKSLAKLFLPDEKGRLTRLWGDDDKLIEMSGYDVEKAYWEEIITASCDSEYVATECSRLEEYVKTVFY